MDVLFTGFGIRLAEAPIGFGSVCLVTTPTGETVLVDTGLHQTRQVVLAALRRRGLGPADIDHVVLTHLHFDHCENVGLFPGATVIVHEDELAEAREHGDADPYIADFWQELLAPCDVRPMSGSTLEIAPGVVVHHLPGHRRGQVGVAVDTTAGTVVCASDVAKNAREILLGEPPVSDPALLEAARSSVAWLRATADIVVPGHDRPLLMVDGVPRWNESHDVLLTIY
ncbi:MBL fold metallo-hydrolase [Streptomyces sp. NPDC005708]|uniref:MBL fold metallo-hydrolase n=1 Tax=Streptomyces sp. NPDC005708 TaxID=3154564 RepID=UPI0033E4C86E